MANVLDYYDESRGERVELGSGAQRFWRSALVAGIIALAVSVGLGYLADPTLRRFYVAYLVSYCFFLTVSLGGLFFALLQHVSRAGWSVCVRRIAEALAATMPVLAILALPIAIAVLARQGQLYSWAQDGGDGLSPAKRAYLNPAFFLVRLAICLGVWSALGVWYWRKSTTQDVSGEQQLTSRMEAVSSPAMVAYAITVTVAAYDLLMSLDPHWFSTIFGVYIFAGAAVGSYAAIVLVLAILQRLGLLVMSVTREHYHDLGKFLFGFVFFWGYIAFSQYMLIWYANIPAETAWLARRGATTAPGAANGWSVIAIMLLFGALLVPFAGLMSRRVKRNARAMVFWAVWLLVFHWLDLLWIAGCEVDGRVHLGLTEIAAFVGVGGIFAAAFVRRLAQRALRPLRDPRLEESLAFENV